MKKTPFTYGITIRSIQSYDWCAVLYEYVHISVLYITLIFWLFLGAWDGNLRGQGCGGRKFAQVQQYMYIVQCMHCAENTIYVFPEKKLCGLVPNSYIHVSVSDLYIPRMGLFGCSKIGRRIAHRYMYKVLRRQYTGHCIGSSSVLDIVQDPAVH